jgi:hypothetical protein
MPVNSTLRPRLEPRISQWLATLSPSAAWSMTSIRKSSKSAW